MPLSSRSRIAIVDDDRPLRTALDNLIRSAGFETRSFGDAETLLGCWTDAGIDLILTDIQMPRMTGLDLVTSLRNEGSDCPIILMTAQPPDETRERAMAAGAFACLEKPFDEDSLFAAIEEALARHHRS